MKKRPGHTEEPAVRRELPLLEPDPAVGLSSQQAQDLTDAGWNNRPVASPTKSDQQIIHENVFTYFNLIFVVLAVVLFLVRDLKDSTFLFIVIINAVIGIVQQIRSKRTIDRLSLLSAAKLRVIRDGEMERRELRRPRGLCDRCAGIYPGRGLRRLRGPDPLLCREGLPGAAAGPVRPRGGGPAPRPAAPHGPAGAGKPHPPQRPQGL